MKNEEKKAMLDFIQNVFQPLGVDKISFCDENGKEKSSIDFKKRSKNKRRTNKFLENCNG